MNSVGDLVDVADVPETAPLVPIRNAVVFPGGVIPLTIGPTGTRAIEAASDSLIAVSTFKDPAIEDPGPGEVFEIGVLARVVKFELTPSGSEVVVQGLARCRVEVLPVEGAHRRARLTPVRTDDEGAYDSLELEIFRSVALRIINRSPEMPANAHELVRDVQVPFHLVDLVVANLVSSIADRQRVLEMLSFKSRMALALELLAPMLDQLPTPPLGSGQCSAHQMPTVTTCLRCGAFVCDACCGVGGTSEICRACRVRRESPTIHSGLAQKLAWGSLAAACLVIVGAGWAIRSVPVIGGPFVLSIALIGFGLGVSSVRIDRVYSIDNFLRPATIGVGLNGLLSLLFGYEVAIRGVRAVLG